MAEEDREPLEREPGTLDSPERRRTRDLANATSTRFEIDFEPGEFDSDSPKVELNEAIRLITRRLPVDRSFVSIINQQSGPFAIHTGQVANMVSELARKIAVLLPEELLTVDALKNMDLRPALQQVMMAPAQETDEGTTEINGVEFTDNERKIAGLSLTTLTGDYKKAWTEGEVDKLPGGAEGDISSYSESMLDTIDEYLYAYREGKTLRMPSEDRTKGNYYVDQASGRLMASDPDDPLAAAVTEDFNLDFDATETSVESRFITQEDIEMMLAGGETDIDYLRQIEQADLAGDPTATDPDNPRTIRHNAKVIYDDTPGDRSYYNEPDHLSANRTKVTDPNWYSITETLSLPGTWSPQERSAMVKRLERAGLLAKGEVMPGDTTAPAFKAAWKTLASSALERGESMLSLLDEREKTYRETVMDSFSTRLTDPARLRISGNNVGRSLLGRALTDDEQAQMVEFIHNLERQNAATEAGLEMNEDGTPIEGVDALDEGITADIDARMEEWIRSENDVEAGANDMADQYEAFTGMLAGPGRGVGV